MLPLRIRTSGSNECWFANECWFGTPRMHENRDKLMNHGVAWRGPKHECCQTQIAHNLYFGKAFAHLATMRSRFLMATPLPKQLGQQNMSDLQKRNDMEFKHRLKFGCVRTYLFTPCPRRTFVKVLHYGAIERKTMQKRGFGDCHCGARVVNINWESGFVNVAG